MKLSIITPTHNPKFLRELEESIMVNHYHDWEWIILLNNKANYKPVNSSDNRIRVIRSKTKSKAVGALKKEACGYATGVAYAKMVVLLVEAVKEQQKQIDKLKTELNKFKN